MSKAKKKAAKKAAKKSAKKKTTGKKSPTRKQATKSSSKKTAEKQVARKKRTVIKKKAVRTSGNTHPRKMLPGHPLLKRLREICLGLPEVYEKEAWGEATFRVTDGTMFAITDFNHHGSGHIAVWVKAPPLAQADLIESDADRYFAPPYMGPKGWVGIRLDRDAPWPDVRALLEEGYRMSLPARRRSG